MKLNPFRLFYLGRIFDILTTLIFLNLSSRYENIIHISIKELNPFTLTIIGRLLELIIILIIYLSQHILINEDAPKKYALVFYLICSLSIIPVVINLNSILFYLKEIILYSL